MLVYKHPEAAKVENFHETVNDDVLEKCPLDVFLQAAGNKLLELEEDLEPLDHRSNTHHSKKHCLTFQTMDTKLPWCLKMANWTRKFRQTLKIC